MLTYMHAAIKYIITTICIALSALSSVRAQVLPEVQNRFENYQRMAIREKLYVHTNKNLFLSGEILWFKVYVVDGQYNKPFNLNKVAYVEVLGADNNPVLQTKIALKHGFGSGSVYIPASVSNGNYHLRAYTSWMKNFGPEYFFDKTITLVNAQKSPEILKSENKIAYDVQFFPEGGHLVKGLSSKVAFKVTGTDGNGVTEYKGDIINQNNDTVARFAPLQFGIGSFTFTPASNDTYRAVIKIANQALVKELPKISDQGYVMQTVDNGDNWTVTVKATGVQGDGNLYLFAHTRQAVKLAESSLLNNGSAAFRVDKAKLEEGISHITLFNSNKQPLCERLVFKYPSKKLTISAQPDFQAYNTRKKVGIAILAKSEKPLMANMSLSIYRADSLQKPDDEDIRSYLWLNSDLRGSIESANFYFSNNTLAPQALDNLLLSQGWRQFNWNNVLSGKADIKFLPEYTGHIVTGKLLDSAGSPAKGINTYLAIPGTRIQLFAARSDSTGRLLFNTKDFYGLSEIVLQTNTQVDSNYKVQILNPFSEQYAAHVTPALNLLPATQNSLESNNLNMQVHNIYAAPKLRQFYEPQVDSAAFYSKPGKSYLLDAYTRFTTIEEVLREYTSWLTVAKRRGKYYVTMFDQTKPLDENPLVLYNGIPLFDMNKTFALDPLKIKKLDVVPSRYFYGPAVFDGILSFTAYKDDLAGFEIDPRAVVLDYEGLQLQRKFYTPVYDTEAQRSSRIPDFRTALYWQPDIITNEQGKCNVSFYTSDKPGKYMGIIQGITANGETGSQTFSFEVK